MNRRAAIKPLFLPAAALLLSACSGLQPVDDLTPEPHPYLTPTSANRVRTSTTELGYAAATVIEPDEPYETDPDPTYQPAPSWNPEPAYNPQHRGLPVARRLKDIEGERRLYGQPVTDLALLKAAYNGISGIAPVTSLTTLRSRTEPRRDGGVQPGDLLFFGGDRHVPSVAVVHRVIGRRTIEAAAVTRGAIRFIRVSPLDPHTRRRGGTVVNTFLRPKFPNDPAGTQHLAGQLLEDVRALVR
jgi:hypothetical protein